MQASILNLPQVIIVFVVQLIPEPALDILHEGAEVSVFPYIDRQITVDKLVANTRRSEYLFVAHETCVTPEVIEANPRLKGIGAMGEESAFIDSAAAAAPEDSGGYLRSTADPTMSILLAWRLTEGDRYTRAGDFKRVQTQALVGQGCAEKVVGLIDVWSVLTQPNTSQADSATPLIKSTSVQAAAA